MEHRNSGASRLVRTLVWGVVISISLAAQVGKEKITPPHPEPVIGGVASRPLPPVTTPGSLTLIPTAYPPRPVDMRLLVLTGDGSEPSYQAIKTFLEQIGVPYHGVVLKNTGGTLPLLNDSVKGYYQGIVLATGNLAVCNGGGCSSALDSQGWSQLDTYAATFGVRTLSLYTFPEPRYGVAFTGCAVSTTESSPGQVSFLNSAAAASVFPYLKRNTPIRVAGAYAYLAAAKPATGETTTSVLRFSAAGTCAAAGGVAGVIHRKADGREYLALMMDHSPDLLHSLLLNYGLINWVTKGVFLGARKIYLSPQVDDILLASDLYDPSKTACTPFGFQSQDLTSDATSVCPEVRITGGDLAAVASWQSRVRTNSQTKNFTVAMAYNGIGTTAAGGAPAADTLTTWIKSNGSRFFWINHTYSHEHLDCYKPVPNSGVCTPADYSQSLSEISENLKAAQALKITPDARGMVTPAYSGLANASFLSAASQSGVRYLVFDALKHTGAPNTGTPNPVNPSILMVPRHATNVYYNVRNNGDTRYGAPVGSEPHEYNDFYGPGGLFPTFPLAQTYSQIIDRESTRLLYAMLRYQPYPVMFHQANLSQYAAGKTLMTDLLDAALTKFRNYCTLPVISLPTSDIGDLLVRRMEYNGSGVQATLTPGTSITLSVTQAATISITGVCLATGCETYGGQSVSHVRINPGVQVTFNIGR